MTSRRDFLASTALIATGLALGPLAACSRQTPAPPSASATPASPQPARVAASLITRIIPATGQQVPVIGAGTFGSYEVPLGSGEFETLKETIRVFFAGGGSVIDTSPNYSNAEDVLGALLAEGGWRERCFLATKLAADDRAALEAQWADSLRRLRTDRVELLQVHNLRAWEIALPYARELKKQGLTKYIGITHYLESGQAETERIMRGEKPDFIQINYSVNAPRAADTLLPTAQALGVAVLINRTFDAGKLFAETADKPLPEWAAGAGVTSWAQMFLKFAVSHPAVTAVIPATGKPDRQADNLKAGSGPLLSQEQQSELVKMFA
jgi:aryl-alcohol dehydrogenase-like predicted oxidoreductase